MRERADQILERERLENSQPNIIVVFDRQRPLSAPKQKEQPKKIQKSEAERKSELKKINSAISVYENRIDALLPKNEQDELKKRKEVLKALRKQAEKALRSEERKRVKEIIKDEEKSLKTIRNGFIQALPQTLKTKVSKMQEKLRELLKKREGFKEAKEVLETRGKKQKIHFVEFELSITMSNEWKENKEFVKTFQKLQSDFLQNRFFGELEMELNSIHLDQFSLHSHAMFKLPDGVTFDQHLRNSIHRDGREAYKILNKAWHNVVEREMKSRFGIEIEEMQSGKRYKSLREFKKENPIPNLEKEEKINPERDMSDLDGVSPHLIEMMRRAEKRNEEINSLFSNGKSTQSESSSNQQVAEAQPSSNPQSINPQNRAKRR